MKNQQQQQQQQRQQHDLETMGLFDSTKNPNLETNHHSSNITLTAEEQHAMPPSPPPPPPPQHFKTIHHQKDIHVPKKINKNHEVIKKLNSLSCTCSPAAQEVPPEAKVEEEESGRERLKRHRAEMAGRVRIPDIWGHEDLLKDWIDCTVFDSSLGNNTIMSARAALVQQRTSNLRINAS